MIRLGLFEGWSCDRSGVMSGWIMMNCKKRPSLVGPLLDAISISGLHTKEC